MCFEATHCHCVATPILSWGTCTTKMVEVLGFLRGRVERALQGWSQSLVPLAMLDFHGYSCSGWSKDTS